ncbi:NUDIX hydrolase domain-like protein [Annulohypoxylon maeteangense]|uniref:NUDIX hydrolase domain-like protein n=1 Tax=Annulohypoxylon maeteangense TaxID=1927788 RepID=UPI0020078454|nr:NUDIX hydrolase domain-like protein [Annulohypoxylon maeteangense]KAI0887155.1 NUDIX hydrolase domain-like protein [Annulohypoxylon maeteangense]
MGQAIPDLPILAEDDSMLSRKFGREIANYFSGSPLNRVSFLRTDYGFLRAAFAHPSASFLLLNNLSPLAKDAANLSYVNKDVVIPLTGEEPFKTSEEEQVKGFNSDITQSVILFLGIDEKKNGFEYREYKGKPYFAVDVTPKGTTSEKATSIIDIVKTNGVSFIDGRRLLSLNAPEAAIFAEARALLDWNARNPFCGGCGKPTLSINAGWKRVCPTSDLAGVPEGGAATERADCPTRHGVSNLSFPRTDPTVIMAVVSADGSKLLLGRNKRFPPNWYSTLAGFLEPGESIEEAVRRETWEESGVTVGRVVIHSSQPWPYPANLMIGAIGQAAPGGETIHLGHDEELTDAKWFTLDEVREGIANGVSALGDPAPSEYKEGSLRLPPQTAIANQLIQAVLKGYLDIVPKI